MADTVLTADIIAQAALEILDNELGVLNTLHRAHESEYSKRVNGYKIGDTISIRRPADFRIRTGATAVPQDVIEGDVQLTIDTQKGVDFDFTTADLTLSVADISERFIQPAIINLVNDIAGDVFDEMYKSTYHWVGTPGEVLDSFSDFTKGPERLDEAAAPQDSRNAALGPEDWWSMLGSNTGLAVNPEVQQALRRAQLGMLGNVETWMTQVMPAHTVGAHGGTPLVDGADQNVAYDTVKSTWSQNLVTDGWTNDITGILRRGDVFTIADVYMVNPKTRLSTGILQQFVVNSDTNSGSTTGPATINISPPIIVDGGPITAEQPHQTVNAAPADDAVITVVGTASTSYKQNLCYHKNAMCLAMVPLEEPAGAVEVSRQTRNGISVRIIPVYNGTSDVSLWRLDVLYGKVMQDPRIATRLSGTA